MSRIACGRDPSKRRGAEEVVRQVEVWMIEEIEGFGSKLQIHAIPPSDVFFTSDTLKF